MDDLKLLSEKVDSYVYDDTDGGTVRRECVFNGFIHLDLSLLSHSKNIRQLIRNRLSYSRRIQWRSSIVCKLRLGLGNGSYVRKRLCTVQNATKA